MSNPLLGKPFTMHGKITESLLNRISTITQIPLSRLDEGMLKDSIMASAPGMESLTIGDEPTADLKTVNMDNVHELVGKFSAVIEDFKQAHGTISTFEIGHAMLTLIYGQGTDAAFEAVQRDSIITTTPPTSPEQEN